MKRRSIAVKTIMLQQYIEWTANMTKYMFLICLTGLSSANIVIVLKTIRHNYHQISNRPLIRNQSWIKYLGRKCWWCVHMSWQDDTAEFLAAVTSAGWSSKAQRAVRYHQNTNFIEALFMFSTAHRTSKIRITM